MYKNIHIDGPLSNPFMTDNVSAGQRETLLAFVENVNGLLKPRLTGLGSSSDGKKFQTEVDKLHSDRVILTVRYGDPAPEASKPKDALADVFLNHGKPRDVQTLHLSACMINNQPVVLVSNECDADAGEVPQDYRAVYNEIERFSKQVTDPSQHGSIESVFENIRSKCAPSQENRKIGTPSMLPRQLQDLLLGRPLFSVSELSAGLRS